ncbi:MAG TPA: pseudouridine synthase [Buchnera sp. (in: enterobacteria)]|nr:pseudouridine synthase [Buchnera sp. (in: enterobacteria)]
MNEKIQKILSRTGYGSRRWIEKMIIANRLIINNKPVKIGQRFNIYDIDTVILDNKKCVFKHPIQPVRILMYHKSNGEICTRKDPKNRKTVFQNLPNLYNAQWIIVGRLDINTSGLLLFTTNGNLANRLMHPKFNIIREYIVRVFGNVNNHILKKLVTGVKLQDGYAAFKKITVIPSNQSRNKWFIVSLLEGRNHEVRRIWKSVGIIVNRLIRIRYGNIILPKNLSPGTWTDIDLHKIKNLYSSVKLIF